MASSARFDELKKKFDENPRRYFAPLANEFRKTGDAEQAVMICEEFLPQQPGHMSGHIVYGQALFDLGRLDEARTVFETALTLDPENLIALRHLGDIARAHGDPESARHWYQRVLDADPRNEEVQALIAELDASGAAAPAAAPQSTGSADAMPMVDLAPSAVDVATPAMELAPPPVDLAETVEVAPPPLPPPSAQPAHASLLELDVVEEQVIAPPPTAAAEPPFDSISLEGLEPTSATAPEPAAHGRAEGFEPMEFSPPHATPAVPDGIADQLESSEFSAPAAPIAPLAGLEESAVGAFEARPAAAPAPLPDLEPMPELAVEQAELPPVDIPPEVIAAEAELIEAREEVVPAPTHLPEPVAPASHAEVSPPAASAVPIEPPRVTPSQPFVTETMAELYVKQGFREQALDVYKLLLAASPESQRLRDRVAELQAPPVEDSGPNVREFFARLASRVPGDRSASTEPPASDDFAQFDSFETVSETGPTAAPAAEPPRAAAAHEAEQHAGGSSAALSPDAGASALPPSEEGAGGSIDALFGQRPVPSADASAASALAQAFGGAEPEAPPIKGRPARAAAGELSLDSVFRDGGARPPRSAQSFSFDQFFSQSATTPRPEESGPTPTPSQGTGAQSEPAERNADDIEQFNSWLQGLKQR